MTVLEDKNVNNILLVYLCLDLLDENIQELVEANIIKHKDKRLFNMLRKHIKPISSQFWKGFAKRLSQVELGEFSDSLDNLATLFNALNGLNPAGLCVLTDFATKFKEDRFDNDNTTYDFRDIWLEFKRAELIHALIENLKLVEDVDKPKLRTFVFDIEGGKYGAYGYNLQDEHVINAKTKDIVVTGQRLVLEVTDITCTPEDEGYLQTVVATDLPSVDLFNFNNFVYHEIAKDKLAFEPDLFYIKDKYNHFVFKDVEVDFEAKEVEKVEKMKYKYTKTTKNLKGQLVDEERFGEATVHQDANGQDCVCVAEHKILLQQMTRYSDLYVLK